MGVRGCPGAAPSPRPRSAPAAAADSNRSPRRAQPMAAPLSARTPRGACKPRADWLQRRGAPALHGRGAGAAPPRPGRAEASGAAIGRAGSLPPIGCGQRSAGEGRRGEPGEERPRRGYRRHRERSGEEERRPRPLRAAADGPAPLPASAARPAPANHGRSSLRANGLGRTSERVYILRGPMASAPREPAANGRRAASDSWPMGNADSPVPRRGGWGSPRRRLRNVNYSTWRRRLPGSRPW